MPDATQATSPWVWRALRGLAVALWHDPTTRRRAWVLLAAGLVCAYSLAVLVYVIAIPEIGVRCAFTPVVNHFYTEFLHPERQEPLREGDRIVQVGDRTVETWSQLLRQMLVLRDREPADIAGLSAADVVRGKLPPEATFLSLDGQRLVRVVYERPGESKPRVAWCRLGPSPLETVIPSVLWFFLKIGLFVVGAIVFWQRPDDPSASRFFWFCIASLGAFMGGYHWSRIVTQPVLLLVFMTCAVLLPAVTLHFYLVFPRPKEFFARRRAASLAVLYGVPLFFLFLFVQGYLRIRWLNYGGADLLEGPSQSVGYLLDEMVLEIKVYLGVAAAWYLASVVCLVHSYRSAASTVERNQVKWILLGAAVALGPIGYSLYLAVWEPNRFGGGGATWPMFAASACITVAYSISITRYRLMQLDKLLSSGAMYFLISTVAGLVYYGVVFAGLVLVGSQVGDGPSLVQVLAVCGTAMLIMLVLDVARGQLKRALDRHFRREKYQLDRTLQRMGQAIDKLVDPPALARRLLHTTADLLSAPAGSVYLRQGEPALYRLTESLGQRPALEELPPGCPLIEGLRAQGTLGPAAQSGSPGARQLQLVGGAFAQGLLHEGQLLGLLVLGPRPELAYTAEEVQLLAAFAQITALALVSAEGHQQIEKLNLELKGKVEKIAEQQRRILALQSQLMKRGEDRNVEAPPAAAEPAAPAHGLVGSGPRVQQLWHLIRRVAASSSAVLLRGESGTGKELLARAIHESSPRGGKPFVKVHCAALSPGLLESELFGHVKGAFTSAIRDKVGRFEAADGGTLFLDEIGDISLEVQTKLLRVLEEMVFERVGSSEPVTVDVRIIAATHRDLEVMISQGRFREDLFFRLNVLPVPVPPLRERVEDIPELVQHFLEVYSHKAGKAVRGVEDDALALLKGQAWPGNVRQLENVIERAVVIAEGPAIGVDDLPDEVKAARAEGPGLATALHGALAERERREREQLVRALAAANGNKAEAARALGLARSTLVSRLKKLGLT